MVAVSTSAPMLDGPNAVLILIIKILFVFGIVQLTDNLVLQPLIFSRSVKAHPLEIFVVTENRHKLVSHFMKALQNDLKVHSKRLEKYQFSKDGHEAIARFLKHVVGLEKTGGIGEAVQVFRNSFRYAQDSQWTGPYLNKLYQRAVWLSEA